MSFDHIFQLGGREGGREGLAASRWLPEWAAAAFQSARCISTEHDNKKREFNLQEGGRIEAMVQTAGRPADVPKRRVSSLPPVHSTACGLRAKKPSRQSSVSAL